MTRSFRVCQPGWHSFLRTQPEPTACSCAGRQGTDNSMRQHVSRPRSRPKWQQRLALTVSSLFAWSAGLAVPAQALAYPGTAKTLGVRCHRRVYIFQIAEVVTPR